MHSILRLIYYACPPKEKVRPLIIQPDTHYIEIITSGVVYYYDNNVRKKYTAGTMFWHTGNEETVHETDPNHPYRCYAFHFSGYPAARIAPHISHWLPIEQVMAFGSDCMKVFHSDILNQEYFADYVYYSLLYRATTPASLMISYPKILTKALSFIEKNDYGDLTVDDIAHYADISRPHLFALFRQHLHCSPYQYMLQQRIDQAKILLYSSNSPIKEISFLCKFNSLDVFFRQFRRITGMTPAEYRRKFSS